MIARPQQIFRDAMKADYAIGAFNTSNLEVAQAIIWGAKELVAPVIIQTSEGAIEYAGLLTLAGIIKSLAADVSIPVILHLDHGKSLAIVKQCIEAGYTSVMIDASRANLEENIRLTREVTDYAHDRQVWVEAELGAMMGREGVISLAGGGVPAEQLTNPDQAGEFVARTQVDALAVSVGTIHGAFTGQEYIRFELLEQIQKAVPDIPIVLHGASGIADAHLQRAVNHHVCKVNVDTELRLAFAAAVKAYVGSAHEDVDPRKILGPAREAVQQVVQKKIELFGSKNVARIY